MRGPIVTTRSSHDTAVGRFYPLGAQVRQQLVLGNDLPAYGGIGTFGIQGQAGAVDMPMRPATFAYGFQPGTDLQPRSERDHLQRRRRVGRAQRHRPSRSRPRLLGRGTVVVGAAADGHAVAGRRWPRGDAVGVARRPARGRRATRDAADAASADAATAAATTRARSIRSGRGDANDDPAHPPSPRAGARAARPDRPSRRPTRNAGSMSRSRTSRATHRSPRASGTRSPSTSTSLSAPSR